MVTKRESYSRKIAFNRGTPLPGKLCVMSGKGLSVSVGKARGTVFYGTRDGEAVPGYYATQEAFVYAARRFSAKTITERLARIYDPRGECRPVTMADLEELTARRELS